jgi:hypothetical protein
MNDTDKIIAAIFAATMTAKASSAEPRAFFGFYDACVAEILEREATESAAKADRLLTAQNKMWG